MRVFAIAAIIALSVPVLAQDSGRTGISTPPPDTQSNDAQPSTPPPDPYGYRPTPPPTPRLEERSQPAPSDSETYGPYKPLAGAPEQPSTPLVSDDDPNSGVVSIRQSNPREVPMGTIFWVRMRQTISTATARPGTPFTAEFTGPVTINGRVLIPPGAKLEGRVTEAHSGRPFHGNAALHLEPHRIVMPDGSEYLIHAHVIDSDQNFATRVDDEGTLYRRENIKSTLATFGITTGTGAAAGAVLGGGVGAVVGAGVGAGIGTAWWLKHDRETVVPKDTSLVFSLNEPVTIARYDHWTH